LKYEYDITKTEWFDNWLRQINPLKFYRKFKKLNKTFIQTTDTKQKQEGAFICALKLQDKPSLTSQRSIYTPSNEKEYPIVIDTGASISCTPCLKDFIGHLKVCEIKDLQGLNSNIPVKGVGEVEWTIVDVFGLK